jgi:hypothetical protein
MEFEAGKIYKMKKEYITISTNVTEFKYIGNNNIEILKSKGSKKGVIHDITKWDYSVINTFEIDENEIINKKLEKICHTK